MEGEPQQRPLRVSLGQGVFNLQKRMRSPADQIKKTPGVYLRKLSHPEGKIV